MPETSAAAKSVSKTAAAEVAIRRFLASSRRPVLVEPGEPPLEINAESYLLEWRAGRLIIQAWDKARTLSRRITGVQLEKPGRLELVVERFGKREGRLLLIDLERTDRAIVEHQSARWVLRELMRRALARQWPGWRIAEISAEANLEESLSPVYPRALLKKGSHGWAALLAPEDAQAANAALSFGLIWLEYLRRREPRLAVEGLLLFLPDGHQHATCLRLAWLDAARARFLVYVYTSDGAEDLVDPSDYGNLDTVLEDQRGSRAEYPPLWEALLASLAGLPGLETVPHNDGSVGLRVRGLEFARLSGSSVYFGIEKWARAQQSHLAEIEQLAFELARLRRADAADRANPIYRLQPERWMEYQVRAQIERVDATLLPWPLYTQVPALAGLDRGVLDLLAVDRTGRLAVLELKATQDIQLPLQALDYWIRVRWHLERGDFTRSGYFPGIALRPEAPRLLLIAPALEFHPTTEIILSFFRPDIEVERIGLGVEWRKEIQVAFRARGARPPVP